MCAPTKRQKYARRCVAIEAEKSSQAERRANVPRETFPVPVSTTAQRRVERCLWHTHSARAEGRKHRGLVDQFEHLLHDLLVEQMVVGQQFLQVLTAAVEMGEQFAARFLRRELYVQQFKQRRQRL